MAYALFVYSVLCSFVNYFCLVLELCSLVNIVIYKEYILYNVVFRLVLYIVLVFGECILLSVCHIS